MPSADIGNLRATPRTIRYGLLSRITSPLRIDLLGKRLISKYTIQSIRLVIAGLALLLSQFCCLAPFRQDVL